MRQFVESLKRLYEQEKIFLETIESLRLADKISEEEKMYIVGKTL